jgi:hypothetical protein
MVEAKSGWQNRRLRSRAAAEGLCDGGDPLREHGVEAQVLAKLLRVKALPFPFVGMHGENRSG